jgi:hypothetical protein
LNTWFIAKRPPGNTSDRIGGSGRILFILRCLREIGGQRSTRGPEPPICHMSITRKLMIDSGNDQTLSAKVNPDKKQSSLPRAASRNQIPISHATNEED